MSFYANLNASPQSITTPRAHYQFPVLGYYYTDEDLSDYVTSGVLTTVADSWPDSEDGATMATKVILNSLYSDSDNPRELWFGIIPGQTATRWGDPGYLVPFRATSGANQYGTDTNDEAQVIGSGDTPIQNKSGFTVSRVLVTAHSSNTVYKLRFIWGSGTMIAAVSGGQYTEVLVIHNATEYQAPIEVFMPRIPSGMKVWVQAWNATDNATIDFFAGVREFD